MLILVLVHAGPVLEVLFSELADYSCSPSPRDRSDVGNFSVSDVRQSHSMPFALVLTVSVELQSFVVRVRCRCVLDCNCMFSCKSL